jgi:hypothetical protein
MNVLKSFFICLCLTGLWVILPVSAETLAGIKRTAGTLPAARPKINCGNMQAIKAIVKEDDRNSFWARNKSQQADFIFFDAKTSTISVCYNGKIVTALFEGAENKDTVVEVNKDFDDDRSEEEQRKDIPFLQDLNQDGKPEFIVFFGQCAEGPCLGEYLVFQIDGSKIRKLYSVQADEIKITSEHNRTGFFIRHNCYDYEFGAPYDYFDIAEVNSRGFKIIPYSEIRQKYPKTLQSFMMRRSGDPTKPVRKFKIGSGAPIKPIQKLIYDAYQGVGIVKLTKAFKKLPEEGLHCNPLEIIQQIAGKP